MMSTVSSDMTVGQLVAERPARAKVFEGLGIDYCCGGKVSLDEACKTKGLDANTVVRMIAATESNGAAGGAAASAEPDWTTAPLGALVDNIVAVHHDYLREELPRLTMLTEKVAAAHGRGDERLPRLAEVCAGFREELESHMAKEEQILFPLIKKIEKATSPVRDHCGSIKTPISVMEREHDDAGNDMVEFRRLTDDYTPPATACNTFRAMLDALTALEANMHRHVHKENSILFPRAIAREEALREPAAV
jgi:regulator of cell morphogenesis and NO signaling